MWRDTRAVPARERPGQRRSSLSRDPGERAPGERQQRFGRFRRARRPWSGRVVEQLRGESQQRDDVVRGHHGGRVVEGLRGRRQGERRAAERPHEAAQHGQDGRGTVDPADASRDRAHALGRGGDGTQGMDAPDPRAGRFDAGSAAAGSAPDVGSTATLRRASSARPGRPRYRGIGDGDDTSGSRRARRGPGSEACAHERRAYAAPAVSSEEPANPPHGT